MGPHEGRIIFIKRLEFLLCLAHHVGPPKDDMDKIISL